MRISIEIRFVFGCVLGRPGAQARTKSPFESGGPQYNVGPQLPSTIPGRGCMGGYPAPLLAL